MVSGDTDPGALGRETARRKTTANSSVKRANTQGAIAVCPAVFSGEEREAPDLLCPFCVISLLQTKSDCSLVSCLFSVASVLSLLTMPCHLLSPRKSLSDTRPGRLESE